MTHFADSISMNYRRYNKKDAQQLRREGICDDSQEAKNDTSCNIPPGKEAYYVNATIWKNFHCCYCWPGDTAGSCGRTGSGKERPSRSRRPQCTSQNQERSKAVLSGDKPGALSGAKVRRDNSKVRTLVISTERFQTRARASLETTPEHKKLQSRGFGSKGCPQQSRTRSFSSENENGPQVCNRSIARRLDGTVIPFFNGPRPGNHPQGGSLEIG